MDAISHERYGRSRATAMGRSAVIVALIALAIVTVPLIVAATLASGPIVLVLFVVGLGLSAALKL